MTDNRTTEKLRKLLEERGIKWRETINHANCIFTWWESPTFGIVYAMDNEDGETLFMACLNSCDFAPEQAIAATLGSDDEYEAKMDALLCRLTNGKWSKSRAYSIEFMDACVSEEFEALYSEEQFSAPVSGTLTAKQVWKAIFDGSSYASYDGVKYYADGIGIQAIADELNAELGSGTCVVTHDFKCSNCGKQIGVVRNCEMYETCDGQQAWKSLDNEVCDIPNFCQNCGAKVVGK